MLSHEGFSERQVRNHFLELAELPDSHHLVAQSGEQGALESPGANAQN